MLRYGIAVIIGPTVSRGPSSAVQCNEAFVHHDGENGQPSRRLAHREAKYFRTCRASGWRSADATQRLYLGSGGSRVRVCQLRPPSKNAATLAKKPSWSGLPLLP